ncbi:MAG: hypothetical protein PF572_01070 [Patescibacteria group bacterium]|jgi:uncharacterized BrkB/YihY/UPF0761 family membrane protein|nr:hypothetical protein [Patescibacteria group bacterium]
MKKFLIITIFLFTLLFPPDASIASSSTTNLTADSLWVQDPSVVQAYEEKKDRENVINAIVRSFFGILLIASLVFLIYSVSLLVYCFFAKKNKHKALKFIIISITSIVLIFLSLYMLFYIQHAAYHYHNPTA